MSPEPTIFLVGNDTEVRDSLSRLLHASGYSTKTYPTVEAFAPAFDPAEHGCLILDLQLGRTHAGEAQSSLAGYGIDLPLIVISGPVEISEVVRMMKAGASDFLEKPIRSDDLLLRIEEALEEGERVRRSREEHSETLRRLETLTRRERETMELLLTGMNTKQIARELAISPKTVDNHRASVMKKMRVDSAVELLRAVHHLDYAESMAGA